VQQERTARQRSAASGLLGLYRYALVGAGMAMTLGCATTFEPAALANSPFINRTTSQSERGISISAAVLSADEFEQLTGVDVADEDIQPLWLSIENDRERPVRIAYASIDPDYYSPLELAWAYRKDFRKRSRDDVEMWFYETKLPRAIPAGGSRSGFIYTQAVEGTKGFNVDVYDGAEALHFTFFVPLPGFTPDYMNVDFAGLYEDDEISRTDRAGLRDALRTFPCCTTNEAGQANGDPLNVVMAGSGQAVLRSLLRGGWHETESGSALTRMSRAQRFHGRPPDGIFFRSRPDGSERKELRLWLAPMLVDDDPVWVGTVAYEMSGNLADAEDSNRQIDPDIDDARMYIIQNFWYAQSLEAFALAPGVGSAPIDAPRENFLDQPYFTDGNRAVMFVADEPVGMDETEILFWEQFFER
jgi:hypothetical protein